MFFVSVHEGAIAMPTPFELFQDPIIQAVFALYGAMLAWEALRPARALPRLRLWWLRGTLALVAYVLVSSYVPLWLAEPLATLRLVDAASLGTVGGAAVAWAAYELIGYGWAGRWCRRFRSPSRASRQRLPRCSCSSAR
jgi:hypothetical protein